MEILEHQVNALARQLYIKDDIKTCDVMDWSFNEFSH